LISLGVGLLFSPNRRLTVHWATLVLGAVDVTLASACDHVRRSSTVSTKSYEEAGALNLGASPWQGTLRHVVLPIIAPR